MSDDELNRPYEEYQTQVNYPPLEHPEVDTESKQTPISQLPPLTTDEYKQTPNSQLPPLTTVEYEQTPISQLPPLTTVEYKQTPISQPVDHTNDLVSNFSLNHIEKEPIYKESWTQTIVSTLIEYKEFAIQEAAAYEMFLEYAKKRQNDGEDRLSNTIAISAILSAITTGVAGVGSAQNPGHAFAFSIATAGLALVGTVVSIESSRQKRQGAHYAWNEKVTSSSNSILLYNELADFITSKLCIPVNLRPRSEVIILGVLTRMRTAANTAPDVPSHIRAKLTVSRLNTV